MGFRENLKSQLEYSGMLIKELAASSGIKKKTIESYLGSTTAYIPSAEAAVKIAKALGISVEYLVNGHDDNRETGTLLFSSPKKRSLLRIFDELQPEDQKLTLDFAKLLKKNREELSIEK